MLTKIDKFTLKHFFSYIITPIIFEWGSFLIYSKFANLHISTYLIFFIPVNFLSIILYIFTYKTKNIYLYYIALFFSAKYRSFFQIALWIQIIEDGYSDKLVRIYATIYIALFLLPFFFKIVFKNYKFTEFQNLAKISIILALLSFPGKFTVRFWRKGYLPQNTLIIRFYVFFICLAFFIIWEDLPTKLNSFIEHKNYFQTIKTQNKNNPFLISINSKNIDVLKLLPKISENKAIKIIKYQEHNGLFNSLNELKKVDSIGEKIVNSIRNYATVIDSRFDSFLDTSSSTSLQIQAQQAYQNQNFTQAKQLYQSILDSSPNDIPALNNLGLCFKNLNQHQQAIQTYHTAIALTDENHPAQPVLYKNLGIALYLNKHRRKAIHFLKKAKRTSQKQNTPLPEIDNILRIVKLEIRHINQLPPPFDII